MLVGDARADSGCALRSSIVFTALLIKSPPKPYRRAAGEVAASRICPTLQLSWRRRTLSASHQWYGSLNITQMQSKLCREEREEIGTWRLRGRQFMRAIIVGRNHLPACSSRRRSNRAISFIIFARLRLMCRRSMLFAVIIAKIVLHDGLHKYQT